MDQSTVLCDQCQRPIADDDGRMVLPLDGGGYVLLCEACIGGGDDADGA